MATEPTTKDRYRQTITTETQCVEVREGGSRSVIGYAILFSGCWDAWVMKNTRRHRLFKKASVLASKESAIEVIKRTWEQQK